MKHIFCSLTVLLFLVVGISCKKVKDGKDENNTYTYVLDISSERPDCEHGARRYVHYKDNNNSKSYDAGEELSSQESCFDDKFTQPPPPPPPPPPGICNGDLQDNSTFTFNISVNKNATTSTRIETLIPGVIDDSTNGSIVELKPNENMFICEDDLSIGSFQLAKVPIGTIKYDIIFIVDNSDSMWWQWFAVREQIKAYLTSLTEKEVDFTIGLVGYNENSNITGAVNLNQGPELLTFLENYGGILANQELQYFLGNDKDDTPLGFFEAALAQENAIPAIIYAKDRFSFRENSRKIYINVTNEFMIKGQEDLDSAYTPDKFCPTWSVDNGLIHTIWMGDVLTDTGFRDGVPFKGDNGEYTLIGEGDGGQLAPTVLTAANCGQGSRQVQQHEYTDGENIVNSRQQGIPQLDFSSLLVTELILETTQVAFITKEDPALAHKLEIFVINSKGDIGKGIFNGIYPDIPESTESGQ